MWLWPLGSYKLASSWPESPGSSAGLLCSHWISQALTLPLLLCVAPEKAELLPWVRPSKVHGLNCCRLPHCSGERI